MAEGTHKCCGQSWINGCACPPDPKMKAPPGYRIDPFADARMGVSLFQMQPEDWLVKDETP